MEGGGRRGGGEEKEFSMLDLGTGSYQLFPSIPLLSPPQIFYTIKIFKIDILINLPTLRGSDKQKNDFFLPHSKHEKFYFFYFFP